jgi:hypothetical protein
LEFSAGEEKTGKQNKIDNFCQSNAIKSCIWHKTREEVIKTLPLLFLCVLNNADLPNSQRSNDDAIYVNSFIAQRSKKIPYFTPPQGMVYSAIY